jgi:hypothetical protein
MNLVVHGDGFTILGSPNHLDALQEEFRQRFEVKFRGRLGPEIGDDKSIKILNRIVEWTERGINYEADHRHVDIVLENLGYQDSTKGLSTPGTKDMEKIDDTKLDPNDTTLFRALA